MGLSVEGEQRMHHIVVCTNAWNWKGESKTTIFLITRHQFIGQAVQQLKHQELELQISGAI